MTRLVSDRNLSDEEVRRLRRWGWAAFVAAVVVAVGAIVPACETPRPIGPENASEGLPVSSAGIPTWDARLLRLRVEESARTKFPAILEPSGPPMQVFLIADARLRVYQGSLTTLNYLGHAGPRPHTAIDVAYLQQALPSFNPERDAWMVFDPQELRGLVRENVRVIWIQHQPQGGDWTTTPADSDHVQTSGRRPMR